MKRFLALVLSLLMCFIAMQASPIVFAEASKSTMVLSSNGSVSIGSAYGSNQKLWLNFTQCGPNRLMQLDSVSKTDAAANAPGSAWLTSYSDWVGPVLMKETGSAEDAIYSGGWHKREDNSPSAASQSIVVKLDGVEQASPVTATGETVEIIVTNDLYVGETLATSKSGMTEVVHYTICDNKIDVSVTLTAERDITITQYFGLQGIPRTYTPDMIRFVNGQENPANGGGSYYTHISGTKANYPNVNAVVHCNEDGDSMTMTLDRTYGLGTLDYLGDNYNIAALSSATKTYFFLVTGMECPVKQGESVAWRGQYAFEQKPSSANVVADFEALSRSSLLTETTTDATVTKNLSLPSVGANGSKIKWQSSDPTVISHTGVVSQPDLTTSVSMTALIYDGMGASMSKTFSFRVPGAEGTASGGATSTVKPENKGQLIYAENFDDNSINTDMITVTSSGNMSETNGALLFSRPNKTDAAVEGAAYLQEGKEPIQGNVVVEFDFTNGAWTALSTYVIGSAGRYLQIAALSQKNYTIYYYNANGANANTPVTWTNYAPHVTIAIDTEKGTFRLWFDDTFICSGYGQNADATGGVSHLYFAQAAGSFGTNATIDNLASYSNIVYYDDFNSETLSDHVVPSTTYGANVKVSSGKLMVPTTAGSNSSAKIYLNEDQSAATGRFSIELAVSRTSCSHAFDVYFGNSSGNHSYFRWWGGSTNMQWAKPSGEAEVTYLSGVADGRVKLLLKGDAATGQVKLWVNDQFVGTGYSRLENKDITHVSFAAFDASCNPGVEYFKYTDLSNEAAEITEYAVDYNPYDKKVSVVSIKNAEATVIAAAYAGNKLISAVPATVTLVQSDDVLADTSALSVQGADRVVIYLWSSISGLQPLCEEFLIEEGLSSF